MTEVRGQRFAAALSEAATLAREAGVAPNDTLDARAGGARTRRILDAYVSDLGCLCSRYPRFLFAKSQFTMFQNASMNLGRALR